MALSASFQMSISLHFSPVSKHKRIDFNNGMFVSRWRRILLELLKHLSNNNCTTFPVGKTNVKGGQAGSIQRFMVQRLGLHRITQWPTDQSRLGKPNQTSRARRRYSPYLLHPSVLVGVQSTSAPLDTGGFIRVRVAPNYNLIEEFRETVCYQDTSGTSLVGRTTMRSAKLWQRFSEASCLLVM